MKRKQADKQAISLRVHRESVEKLDRIASDCDRSRSSVINQAVRAYITQYEEKHGRIIPENQGR